MEDKAKSEALALLNGATSSNRAAGARKALKLQSVELSEPIMVALLKEPINRPRPNGPWEKQIALIAALAASQGSSKAIEFLNDYSAQDFEATAIYESIGSALITLVDESDRARMFKQLLKTRNPSLVSGASLTLSQLDPGGER